jgi:3'-5' exoribonuclease
VKLNEEEIKLALQLSGVVLNNEKFAVWSGSGEENHHHYGGEGLKKHTFEVIDLMNNVKSTLKLDLDDYLIQLAGLYHDIGKIYDYELKSELINNMVVTHWVKTEHCRKIHHISRSAIIWNQEATKLNFPQIYIDEITHAILSHHGGREYGSPVAPKSKLAWLLHLCDNLSARMNDCDKIDLIKS